FISLFQINLSFKYMSLSVIHVIHIHKRTSHCEHVLLYMKRGNQIVRGSKVTCNPHVVSVCPKARNPHVVSDCQPSNPPGPEPAGTNIHYPRTRHQHRDNFKLGEGVKHSVATWGIRTRVRIGVLITSRPLASPPPCG
ncbi:unnamed protein product, partial [Brassica rapa]